MLTKNTDTGTDPRLPGRDTDDICHWLKAIYNQLERIIQEMPLDTTRIRTPTRFYKDKGE